MATARVTLGSVLGSVNDVASSVSAVFNTTTKAIGMANKYVSDAAEKQNIRSIIEMHDFQEKLAEETAMAETLRKREIQEFCALNEKNAELFQISFDRIKGLLAERNP